jgi:hypothetical protein
MPAEFQVKVTVSRDNLPDLVQGRAGVQEQDEPARQRGIGG